MAEKNSKPDPFSKMMGAKDAAKPRRRPARPVAAGPAGATGPSGPAMKGPSGPSGPAMAGPGGGLARKSSSKKRGGPGDADDLMRRLYG